MTSAVQPFQIVVDSDDFFVGFFVGLFIA